MGSNISTFIVFLEGVASFLSPCVFPLMPIYLSYITGGSLDEIEGNNRGIRGLIIINSIGFLLGLTIVFTLLGATATTIGKFLYINNNIIRKIGGIFIIIFGLYHIGLLKLEFLGAERRFAFKDSTPKFINSVILGMAFSFGWTPCIGPILGSVLMMAANLETYGEGIYLLAIYSLGFSIPFFITAVFLDMVLNKIDIERHLNKIKIISGVLLIITGILVYTNQLYKIINIFS